MCSGWWDPGDTGASLLYLRAGIVGISTSPTVPEREGCFHKQGPRLTVRWPLVYLHLFMLMGLLDKDFRITRIQAWEGQERV